MVGGNVLYVQAGGLAAIIFPTFFGFSGQSVYKVDTDVLKPCLSASVDCLDGCPGSMAAFSNWSVVSSNVCIPILIRLNGREASIFR